MIRSAKLKSLIICGAFALPTNGAFAATTTYTYDSLGRVVSASFPDGKTATYTYDTAGNRTAYVVTATAHPVAHNVSATVKTNSSNNPIPPNITGGTPISVAISTGPAHGSASANGLTIGYTPSSGYSGADSFAYTASNVAGTSSPATASITVSALAATFSPTLNCGSPASYVCDANQASGFTFPSVTVSVTGGSGSYTYAWTPDSPSGGTWTSGTAATFTPMVSAVASGATAQATYTCTVTDTVTGAKAKSNAVLYQFTYSTGGCGPAGCG
jgi:YD repeat-containing protein